MKMRDGPVVVAVSKLSSGSAANNAKNPSAAGAAVVCVGMIVSS